jgi:hypothetical protein
MPLDNPKIHPGSAPEFIPSGIPYVTGAILTLGQTQQVSFGYITRSVTVRNYTASTALAVAWTNNGLKPANGNYFILSGSESYADELRCTSIFLSASVGSPTYALVAGLTRIPASAMETITGSSGVG